MARKVGSGNVKVNGRTITTQNYKDAAIQTLKELGTWVNTDTIISYAANKGLVEPKGRNRKAHSHPMFKIMSMFTESWDSPIQFRYNHRGILEYKMK